jgi:uncharacterized protein (TIGR02757 family)
MPMITTATSSRRFAAVERMGSIKAVLEKLYAKYNHREFIKSDPLQFVYHYSKPADMEVAALLAASLAYGRVQQIEKNLNDLFGRMGTSPYAFVMNFDKAGRQKLNSFKHRFTTGRDISDLLSVLKKVLRQKGSIEKHFSSGYNKGDENILPALSRFCDSLYEIYSEQNGRKVSRGMKYLLASPVRGSACKRLNLFLRWMVRDDEVDTGLWNRIDKAKLIVPVDVHVGRLCRILGFHDRKVISLSTAVKITDCFAEIEPADPVKYDFALSRIGILGNCTGRLHNGCEICELFKFCSRR